ncbi:myb-like protein D [Sitophilus oryzae]|uniref:Myb-like protein D n=1 Tax=Sitophilus oryzae TaxID=7048 RepID=A0A6J2XTP1_SITOR|nr:myb-like protein D [Sitophilus oryzae]
MKTTGDDSRRNIYISAEKRYRRLSGLVHTSLQTDNNSEFMKDGIETSVEFGKIDKIESNTKCLEENCYKFTSELIDTSLKPRRQSRRLYGRCKCSTNANSVQVQNESNEDTSDELANDTLREDKINSSNIDENSTQLSDDYLKENISNPSKRRPWRLSGQFKCLTNASSVQVLNESNEDTSDELANDTLREDKINSPNIDENSTQLAADSLKENIRNSSKKTSRSVSGRFKYLTNSSSVLVLNEPNEDTSNELTNNILREDTINSPNNDENSTLLAADSLKESISNSSKRRSRRLSDRFNCLMNGSSVQVLNESNKDTSNELANDILREDKINSHNIDENSTQFADDSLKENISNSPIPKRNLKKRRKKELSEKEIIKYYLDKTFKKRFNSLETIFEAPAKQSMSVRKYKRFLTFDNSQSKINKRHSKVLKRKVCSKSGKKTLN